MSSFDPAKAFQREFDEIRKVARTGSAAAKAPLKQRLLALLPLLVVEVRRRHQIPLPLVPLLLSLVWPVRVLPPMIWPMVFHFYCYLN